MKLLPIIGLIAAIALQSCKDENKGLQGDKAVNAAPAEAVVLVPELLHNTIVSSGNILATEEVTLKSELAGRIIEISFNEGMPVKAGQVLFRIDDSEYLAELQKVGVQLKLAESDFGRQKKLKEIAAISNEQFEAAENRVAELKAEKLLLEARTAKTAIKAPFDGVAGLRKVSPGAFVSPGDILTTVVQKDKIKVEFPVPESYAMMIEKGQKVKVSITGKDTFDAVIYAMEPSIEANSRNLLVRAESANPGIMPGSFANVSIPLNEIPNALLLPTEALIADIKGQKVLQVKDGKVKSTPVVTGMRSGSAIYVMQGLEQGDTVLVTGLLQLKEGTAVAPKIVNWR